MITFTSEIDAIFSSKTNGKDVNILPLSSAAVAKKKKSTKKHRKEDEKRASPPRMGKKRPAPETIIDPSIDLSKKKTRLNFDGSKNSASTKQPTSKVEQMKDDLFADSRGTSSRRKTEEGFAIYKEDELGITNEGGDTPLCPFDCQCCF